MTDDDWERVRAKQYRRVDAQIEAHRSLEAAEASDDMDAISEAEETALQADLALAEPAGDMVRNRMGRAIKHLDNQGDDPATSQRRGLIMLGRFLTDMRSLCFPKLADVAAADTLRHLDGVEGQLLSPVVTGPGPKGFGVIDRIWIRRYVLRVFVACARTGKTQEQFLASLLKSPTLDRFRGWSQLVPVEEREMATEIGEALSAGRSLSGDQAALWDQIRHSELVEIYGYIARLDPKTVHPVS